MKEVDTMFDLFARRQFVDDLHERVEAFSQIEHIKAIKEIYLPKVQEFSDHVDEWQEDNEDIKDCVAKFDMALSLKASKAELQVQKEDFERKFVY